MAMSSSVKASSRRPSLGGRTRASSALRPCLPTPTIKSTTTWRRTPSRPTAAITAAFMWERAPAWCSSRTRKWPVSEAPRSSGDCQCRVTDHLSVCAGHRIASRRCIACQYARYWLRAAPCAALPWLRAAHDTSSATLGYGVSNDVSYFRGEDEDASPKMMERAIRQALVEAAVSPDQVNLLCG